MSGTPYASEQNLTLEPLVAPLLLRPNPRYPKSLSVSANVKSRGCDPTPLMLIEDHVFDQDGAPLHVSKQVLRGDKHQYSMHMPHVVG